MKMYQTKYKNKYYLSSINVSNLELFKQFLKFKFKIIIL